MKEDILLHSCCAPCLTVAEEKLQSNSNLTIFWYNPNIEPMAEHAKRFETLKSYLEKSGHRDRLDNFEYDYQKENALWHQFIEGTENEPEGGERCIKCIEFRLRKTAMEANRLDCEFTTTLTTSPHKNATAINQIGQKIEKEIGPSFLFFDFKKNDGYKRSIELSRFYSLYRQGYCGCEYSRR